MRLTDIGFRVPPALEPVRERVLSIVEQLEEFQVEAAEELGIDEDGVPFHVKKEVTSALRRLAPIGLSTDIVWTANARTLRHVIEMRTAEGAEEELRLVFDKIARIMQAEAPDSSRTSPARTTAPGCPSTARSEDRPGAPTAGALSGAQASIERVRQAPSASSDASHSQQHDERWRCPCVTRRRACVRSDGAEVAIAWLRIALRALPRESMLASSGLATTCQAISAMIAAGFEVVSEAKPTATTQTTPVASSAKPKAVQYQRGVGVGGPEANA